LIYISNPTPQYFTSNFLSWGRHPLGQIKSRKFLIFKFQNSMFWHGPPVTFHSPSSTANWPHLLPGPTSYRCLSPRCTGLPIGAPLSLSCAASLCRTASCSHVAVGTPWTRGLSSPTPAFQNEPIAFALLCPIPFTRACTCHVPPGTLIAHRAPVTNTPPPLYSKRPVKWTCPSPSNFPVAPHHRSPSTLSEFG
jgi:hypothetical protein